MIDGRFVDCRYCGKPVAQDAEFCPACGTACPDKSAFVVSQIKKLVVCVFLIAVVIRFAWPWLSYFWKPEPMVEQNSLEFSASQLWSIYQQDWEVAAEKYDDKPVSVTGKIIEVSEFMRFPCLTLEVDENIYYGGVICMFDTGDTQALSCQVGDTVTVNGVCSGIDYGITVWRDERYPVNTDYIWLKRCR